jgi:hypothetical protein
VGLQLTPQSYTKNFARRKGIPTFELWQFAARYALLQMENDRRYRPNVHDQIKTIPRDSRIGIRTFVEEAIPFSEPNSARESAVRTRLLCRKMHERRRCTYCSTSFELNEEWYIGLRMLKAICFWETFTLICISFASCYCLAWIAYKIHKSFNQE